MSSQADREVFFSVVEHVLNDVCKAEHMWHRRNQGTTGPCPPKFLEYLVILCFEMRTLKAFSKPHLVIIPRTLLQSAALAVM